MQVLRTLWRAYYSLHSSMSRTQPCPTAKLSFLVSKMTNNNYLSPTMYTRHRSPSTSSSTSTKSTRLQPKSTSSTLTASRSTSRTITTLTPSISMYARRKSSVSSTASTASSTTTIATSSTSISTHHSAQLLPGSENVKVVVRCRPLAQQEFRDFATNCWDILVQEAKVRLSDYGLQKRREVNKGRQVEHRYGKLVVSALMPHLRRCWDENSIEQITFSMVAIIWSSTKTVCKILCSK